MAEHAELLDALAKLEISYRQFAVPKRAGGHRIISSPDEKLRKLQQRVLHELLYQIPVDICAKAYVPKRSALDAARVHVRQRVIVKFDVSNFFSSLKQPMVYRALKLSGLPGPEAALLASMCCFENALPQGAPTSGYLSNIVLKEFDKRFYQYCRRSGLRYTRYSDDITVSGNCINLLPIEAKLRTLLRKVGLELNSGKTKLITSKSRQIVTGVIVNEKMSLGRTYIRDLRKQLYYAERFGLADHANRTGLKSQDECRNQLLGKIAYAEQVMGRKEAFSKWRDSLADL